MGIVMTNRTEKDIINFHGADPQNLIEYIVKKRIYESLYWKEFCFGLSAETLIDNAVELNCVGGTIGGCRNPTRFLCLILKMLKIQPVKEVYFELVLNEDYKYVRLLGAFYLRLIGTSTEIYQYLEPLLHDYRKIRVQTVEGSFILSHVDEIIEDLLTKDVVFDTALPRIHKRFILEHQGYLGPKDISVFDSVDKSGGT